MGTSKILIDGIGIDLTADTVSANKMLSGTKAHDSNGDAVTGTIPSKAAATYMPTTSDQTIVAGQYLSGAQTIRGDANLIAANIHSGKSIFGVNGASAVVDTSDADATANDLAPGKTAYVNGERIKGWDAALPAEYQRVEYIETNSSHAAVINSGVKLSEDCGVFKVEAIFELNGWFENSAYSAVFSSTDHRYSIHYRHSGQENIIPEVGWYSTSYNDAGNRIPLNTRLHCLSLIGVSPLNNDATRNLCFSVIKYNTKNEPSIFTSTFSPTTYPSTVGMAQPFGIFGRYNSPNNYSYRTGVKLYRLRIWLNGTLIRDYYPCYRKTDGAIGLYDVVDDQLYLPENKATFLKGADI